MCVNAHTCIRRQEKAARMQLFPRLMFFSSLFLSFDSPASLVGSVAGQAPTTCVCHGSTWHRQHVCFHSIIPPASQHVPRALLGAHALSSPPNYCFFVTQYFIFFFFLVKKFQDIKKKSISLELLNFSIHFNDKISLTTK